MDIYALDARTYLPRHGWVECNDHEVLGQYYGQAWTDRAEALKAARHVERECMALAMEYEAEHYRLYGRRPEQDHWMRDVVVRVADAEDVGHADGAIAELTQAALMHEWLPLEEA